MKWSLFWNVKIINKKQLYCNTEWGDWSTTKVCIYDLLRSSSIKMVHIGTKKKIREFFVDILLKNVIIIFLYIILL